MKIGIFCGSFDPIGKHHEMIIKYLISTKVLDKIIIMPIYESYTKNLTNGIHRLAMCNIIAKKLRDSSLKNVYVSDYIIAEHQTDCMYDIIKNYINNASQDDEYFYIIGMDNINSVEKLIKWKESIDLIRYIIVKRTNYFSDKIIHFKNNDLIIEAIDEKSNIYSSTNIRKLLKQYYQSANSPNSPNSANSTNSVNRVDLLDLIDEDVFEYIKSYNLYLEVSD